MLCYKQRTYGKLGQNPISLGKEICPSYLFPRRVLACPSGCPSLTQRRIWTYNELGQRPKACPSGLS